MGSPFFLCPMTIRPSQRPSSRLRTMPSPDGLRFAIWVTSLLQHKQVPHFPSNNPYPEATKFPGKTPKELGRTQPKAAMTPEKAPEHRAKPALTTPFANFSCFWNALFPAGNCPHCGQKWLAGAATTPGFSPAVATAPLRYISPRPLPPAAAAVPAPPHSAAAHRTARWPIEPAGLCRADFHCVCVHPPW